MESTWIDHLKTLVSRNRPRHKPQLWEDFPLAARRRVELALRSRVQPDWLDVAHVVDLSRVGMESDGGPPTRMSLMLRDTIARALFLYGSYEISGTRLMQSFLEPGMTFVDVGANIGYYSLLAARAVGHAGTVYAFEPNAAVRPRLKENLRLNDLLERVRILPQAVSRTSGEIRFYRSIVPENSGLSSILPGDCRSPEAEVIPAVSLDDFAAALPRQGRIDLMKIDVEGAELEVLAGGAKVLARADAPAIIFETLDTATAAAVLGPHGYSIRRLHYTMAGGLDLIELDRPFRGIFDDYEPPNYFAIKDAALFAHVMARANARRAPSLRLLGRL